MSLVWLVTPTELRLTWARVSRSKRTVVGQSTRTRSIENTYPPAVQKHFFAFQPVSRRHDYIRPQDALAQPYNVSAGPLIVHDFRQAPSKASFPWDVRADAKPIASAGAVCQAPWTPQRLP
jgi:hypothetical protein